MPLTVTCTAAVGSSTVPLSGGVVLFVVCPLTVTAGAIESKVRETVLEATFALPEASTAAPAATDTLARSLHLGITLKVYVRASTCVNPLTVPLVTLMPAAVNSSRPR